MFWGGGFESLLPSQNVSKQMLQTWTKFQDVNKRLERQ